MRIIACQHDYIMANVQRIELDATQIQFESDRYYQMWQFDSEENAEKAFAELKAEIRNCVLSDKDCLLDEAIIMTRVRASLNRDHDEKIDGEKTK